MKETALLLGRILFKLLLISSISFFILYMLPGDPARIVLGPKATTQSLNEFAKLHALDRPVYEQFLLHIGNLASLNLGNSITRGSSVVGIMTTPLKYTLELLFVCVVCFWLFSFVIPIAFLKFGMRKALNTYISLSAFVAFVPIFVVATVLVILSAKTGWVDLGSRPIALIFGGLIISAYPISLGNSMLRDSIFREMQTGYVLRANGFGLQWWSILKLEILPNSLSSYFSIFTSSIVYFVTGTILVEIIIGFPGIGRLAIESIHTKDLPLLHGCTLVFSIVAVLASEGLEFCRRWIAPVSLSNTRNRW